jgi:hypothetical protein
MYVEEREEVVPSCPFPVGTLVRVKDRRELGLSMYPPDTSYRDEVLEFASLPGIVSEVMGPYMGHYRIVLDFGPDIFCHFWWTQDELVKRHDSEVIVI